MIILIVIPSVCAEDFNDNLDLSIGSDSQDLLSVNSESQDFLSDVSESQDIIFTSSKSQSVLSDSQSTINNSNSQSANDLASQNDISTNSSLVSNSNESVDIASSNLAERILNAEDGDIILIEPGFYKLHGIDISKSITLQGTSDPRDVVIDGEKISSIFLIHDYMLSVKFYNLTIQNGLSENFGGGICIETGNVTVDNCIFINGTALNNTNGGAISNYGNEEHRSYLFVNNSLFIGNHADHDGGAVTTCYAVSNIYNSLFMNNSAGRDGGAIRVSIYGYGSVEDCVFIDNYAAEWAGAYYSWAGNSSINRCVFVNNTAGTNGGAVMVSGSLNLTNSLITNNTGGETGGSFYIQQPMFDALTVIKVNNNIITNNSSPLGKEIFTKWNRTDLLFANFNGNNWGDEDPTDSEVFDPNNVSTRSRPTQVLPYRPFNPDNLNWGLLDLYEDVLDTYYGRSDKNSTSGGTNSNYASSSEDYKPGFKVREDSNGNSEILNSQNSSLSSGLNLFNQSDSSKISSGGNSNDRNSSFVSASSQRQKMVELFEDNPISIKSSDLKYLIVLAILALTFLIGLSRRSNRNK